MSVCIIAELSANHCGDISLAKKTILAAKDCGADAVKLQTYTPDTITFNSKNKIFQTSQGTLWEGRTMYDLYSEAQTPWEWHGELKIYTESLGMEFFSSPFDYTAIDFLESINVPRFKIASPEAMDFPLISYAARLQKPMIISAGMVSLEEIEGAIRACHLVGNNDVTLLKCTSEYPAPISKMNLQTLTDMKNRFGALGVKVGLSDHSMCLEPVIAAVALGAVMVEKHLILDRSLGGVDSFFSLNVKEFSDMVCAVRNTEQAMGAVYYEPDGVRKRGARSLFIVKDIKAGETLTSENVRSIRPSNGLHPKHYPEVIGKQAQYNISPGTPLEWHHILQGK